MLVVLIVTTLFLCSECFGQRQRPNSKSYRTDYEYNRDTDAFYKFHPESRRNSKAIAVCEIEGAELMKIESPEDLSQAHGMFKRYPDLKFYAWVARDGLSHAEAEEEEEEPYISNFPVSLEEEPPSADDCDVLTRTGEMETSKCYGWHPFFCKVKAPEAPYNPRCDVYGKNYVYMEAVGSCYKIPVYPYTWNEAYAECRAEGAHLLVLNSEAESHAVQNLTRVTKVNLSSAPWFYFAGYRAHRPEGNEPVVFKTIFNQTLEEAGFNEWCPNEPNNANGDEYCGSFFNNNGKLNDVNCNHLFGFICEKEVPK